MIVGPSRTNFIKFEFWTVFDLLYFQRPYWKRDEPTIDSDSLESLIGTPSNIWKPVLETLYQASGTLLRNYWSWTKIYIFRYMPWKRDGSDNVRNGFKIFKTKFSSVVEGLITFASLTQKLWVKMSENFYDFSSNVSRILWGMSSTLKLSATLENHITYMIDDDIRNNYQLFKAFQNSSLNRRMYRKFVDAQLWVIIISLVTSSDMT